MKLPKGTFKKHYARQRGRCYYCGESLITGNIEIDHIIPFSKSKDGTNKNICLTCVFCNRTKSDKNLYEFYHILKSSYPEKLIRNLFYFNFINIPYYD